MEQKKTLNCKHFPIDATNSFVQLQVTMSEAEYNELLNKRGDTTPVFNNKGRALIQCLDCSGSMSGAPMEAQKAGISHTGKIIFDSEVSPFEHLVTLAYTHQIKQNDAVDATDY